MICKKKLNCLVAMLIVTAMLVSAILPTVTADSSRKVEGFDKGPSYKPVIPLKKTTFVNFDEETYLDDYAYLAAVPSSVFDDGENLYSNPLLFYQDDLDSDDEKELTLDAKVGIDYFMEDWMEYCNNKLDKMTLINVPKEKVASDWKANDYVEIQSENPYDLASDLALSEWSYSDDAVVAAIGEDFQKSSDVYSGELEGTLNACDVNKENSFELKQTNSLNPTYNEFSVDDKYKYIKAEVWWDCLIIAAGIMIPAGDPDVQLYCKEDEGWMQTSAASYWNVYAPPGHEFTHSHVYKPGLWQVGVTDLPTEGEEINSRNIGPFTLQGSFFKALFQKVPTYYVDVTMYPGVDVQIPEIPPFGCRDVNFTLTWDNPNVDLGLSILGPAGEAVHTLVENEDEDAEEGCKKVHFELLGQCLQDEHYSVSVFSLNDVTTPIDFKVEYEWGQGIPKEESNALTSATEGAVLASTLNAPLLYTKTSKLPESTKETLYKLGVKNIHFVDLGKNSSEDVTNALERIADLENHFVEYDDIYTSIRDHSNTNDVIFTTIDPWTKWYLGELEPGDETKAGLFIGPAAYIAAHHGAPVLIIDNHPRLSSASVWHTEFWSRVADDRYWNPPSVAEMVLTGKRIWSFLEDKDFDKEGLETIITVADQYDIGIPWDRIFPGIANSGRICGTPTDTSCWISRSMFYPAMIYSNPALQGDVTLINGSLSQRSFAGVLNYPYGNTLKITRQTGEETFDFPVLFSPVTHKYRFNERASKYYGCTYECADGLTPGVTPSLNPIDQGSIEKHTGKKGAYFPDMSEIEVVPFYLDKGGYDTAFSTSLDAVVNNLNQGVILWIHGSHGTEPEGGGTLFWDVENGGFSKKPLARLIKPIAGATRDDNPAWGYEWYLGSTEESDTMTMDTDGRIPFTNLPWPLPATGQDWVLARKPLREFLVERPILGPLFDIFIDVDNVYDGVIGTAGFSRYQYNHYHSTEIEEELDNLHSTGFITSICQTSNTYFHLMLNRHGSVFQVQDPWPTSWYATVWRQSIPRDIILGYTAGEAYSRGMGHVGTLYLGGGGLSGDEPQWWWDTAENVVYFGDPDLRVFVPDTTYSDANTWDKPESVRYDAEYSVMGHMPFGPDEYPHSEEEKTIFQEYFWIIMAIVAIVVLLLVALGLGRKQK